MTKKKIIVLCTENSCRSQIADGYLKIYAGEKAAIYSAGIRAKGVNPKAIASMQEDGIDISNHTSNTIEEYNHLDFDFVITVCDNALESCPIITSNAKKFHHNFPDPGKVVGSDEEVKKAFSEVRDQINQYIQQFVAEYL